MNRVARSMFVYGIYTLGLAAALIIAPNIPLPIVGLPQANEVWIRVAGMTVLYLGIIYLLSALNDYRQIIVASVVFRFGVVAFFAAFALAGFTSWNILLLTPFDVIFALWTLYELRAETRTGSATAPARA